MLDKEKVDKLKLNELVKLIKHANIKYYEESESAISDEEYDLLKERLYELSPNHKLLKSVGSKSKKDKVKLPHWMGSMNKYKTQKDIDKWLIKYDTGSYIISDKLDGMAALLTIKDK